MYSMTIGGVSLTFLPAVDGVTGSGGGRPITERTTIEGRIVATRAPLPASRRIRVTAPENHVISRTDAEAIRALAASVFTVTLTGYEPSGTFGGCVFEEPPRFPPSRHPDYVHYDFEIYVPQEG